MTYNLAAVRELLSAAFSSEDLSVFCFDYFEPVYNEFTPQQTKSARIHLLLAYAQRQNRLEKLLSRVQRVNPDQYAAFEARLTSPTFEPGAFDADLEIPAPPEPARPPPVTVFVGRDMELQSSSQQLQTTHLAIITGMAGMGKTILAARLVQQLPNPDRVFWHSFHAGDGIDVIIWKLAGFLAWHGQDNLWRMLHSARLTGGQMPPPPVLFDYLFQMMRGQGYVLCLDDFHHVDEDPLVDQFVQRLRPMVQSGEITFLLTSRRTPDFIQTVDVKPLGGLSLDDTQRLLEQRGLSLSDDLMAELYARTEGNAEFLTLAATALERALEPARLVVRLTETEDIERYLMTEVDRNLSEDERPGMSGVAILLGYPGTRDAIETVLDQGGLRRVLTNLCSRYLLTQQESEVGREYGQHAIVQAFYYDLVSRRERQAMHRRAGEYYATEEPDPLRAARHFQLAGEYTRGAQLATQAVWIALNQGQARALRQVLEGFKPEQMAARLWIEVALARGQVYTWLGDGERARASYDMALADLDKLADGTDDRVLKARAYRLMGTLSEQVSPSEALAWFRRGLDQVAGSGVAEEALLHYRVGVVLRITGDTAAALKALDESLRLLPDGATSWRASVLMSLGNIRCDMGDHQTGQDYYRSARASYEKVHDYWGVMAVSKNSAIELELSGDWAGAVAQYEQALAMARQLGSLRHQVSLELGLGILHTKRGNIDIALTNLSSSLKLARAHALRGYIVPALSSLADLKVRLGEWTAAATSLAEAEALALEMARKDQLREIQASWALVHLAQGEPQAALDYAQRSVALAHDLAMGLEEGSSRRVLGQALSAHGQYEAALAAFEQSLALLADRDPYEAARTRLEWGRALVAHGEGDRGLALLQAARTVFETLGARRDLAEAGDSLNGA